MAKNLIDDIKSDSPEWVKAQAFFQENPTATKLSRAKSHLTHSFINVDGKVYAMANKKQGHLGEGFHGVAKLVQTQAGENFALKIEGIETDATPKAEDPYTAKPADPYTAKPAAPDPKLDRENTLQVLKKLNRFVGAFERDLPGVQIQKLAKGTVKQVSKKHYTIEPWVQGVQLTKRLAEDPPFNQRLIIAQKSMQALEAVHKKGVVHADVHSENFITDGNGNKTTITLIDEGLSKILPEGQLSTKATPAGRKGFVAPELEKQGIYSFASDVYALGKMLQNDIFDEFMPEELNDLIHKMTRKDPSKRPTLEQAQTRLQKIMDKYYPSLNLDQGNLNDRLTAFLQMNYEPLQNKESNTQPFKPEDIIDQGGNCNGWGMLYQIYRSNNMEAEFYDILKTIAKWDIEKNSLQTMPLPPSLSEKYGTLENLLGAVCNNLAMFHANQDTMRKMSINTYEYGQGSRIKQYNLMKDSASNRELTQITSFHNKPVNSDSLVNHLKFMAHFPGSSVDIRLLEEGKQSGHEVSLFVTPDGKFQYYDSNLKVESPLFNSAEECANFIMQKTLAPLHYQNKNGEFILNYDIYKFHDTPDTVLATVIAPNLKADLPNFNNYNELHYAVLENNVPEVQRLLKEQPELANKYALDNHTPIALALNLKNEACFRLLLNAMDNQNDLAKYISIKNLEKDEIEFLVKQMTEDGLSPNFGKKDNNMLTAAFLNGSDNALKNLLSHKDIDVNKLLDNNYYIVNNMKNVPLSKLRILASNDVFINNRGYEGKTPLMSAISQTNVGGMTVINTLLSNKNLDINIKDNDGQTALMYAVMEERFDIIKLLLAKNPDISIKDNEGKTVTQYILDKLNQKDPPLSPEKVKAYQNALSEITTYQAKNTIETLHVEKENIPPPQLIPTQPQKSMLGQYQSSISKSKESTVIPEKPTPISVKISNK